MLSQPMTNTHRPALMTLPGVLAARWGMRQAQFFEQAICVALIPVSQRGGVVSLQPAGEDDEAQLARLQELAARNAPPGQGDPQSWAHAGVQRLLATRFEDLWVSELRGIAHVVLVKESALPPDMTKEDLLRRLHMREVEDALRANLNVPDDVIEEYRSSMERMHTLAPTTAGEMLH